MVLALLAATALAGGWELDGVAADSALEVSPDGRFAVVSVRRVDTNGDGRLAPPDLKSLLLLDHGREIYCFGDGVFAYRDKMPRFSDDGELIALALPDQVLGWTPWQGSDVVVFDPEARVEVARYPDGINPVWLWDGLLAYQRADRVVIAGEDGLVELDPAALVEADRVRLRGVVADPWNERVLASLSAKPTWAGRVAGQGPEDRSRGVMVQITRADGEWVMERLPFEGFMPVPTRDGVYAFQPRGDVNQSGRYEVGADGVDLVRDGEVVVEDVVFHGLYDLDGVRVVLARREGGFVVERVEGPRTLTTGLSMDGATGLVQHGGRTVLVARRDDGSVGTALFLWNTDGQLTPLVDPPALRPVPRAEGLYYLRASSSPPGALVFITWPELLGDRTSSQPGR